MRTSRGLAGRQGRSFRPEHSPGYRSWYADPHGFAERAWAVKRRRHLLDRVIQRLRPEAALWGWADDDGARAKGLAGPLPEPATPRPAGEKMAPELVEQKIHPPFTPE